MLPRADLFCLLFSLAVVSCVSSIGCLCQMTGLWVVQSSHLPLHHPNCVSSSNLVVFHHHHQFLMIQDDSPLRNQNTKFYSHQNYPILGFQNAIIIDHHLQTSHLPLHHPNCVSSSNLVVFSIAWLFFIIITSFDDPG